MQSIEPLAAYGHLELLQAIQQPQPDHDVTVQLVRKRPGTQRACWNRSLSAELSGLILGKTSRYNVNMMCVSCSLLRDTANAAEPITFEASPWSRTRIAAGYGQMLCVNASGNVFAWGANHFGQLGVGDAEKRVVPTLVAGLLKTKVVVQVTAGSIHTACLTADGLVFVCGAGIAGQLGVGNTANTVVPTLVRGELQGKKVLQVAAGGNHTMCVTEDGSVFAFGRNTQGQLGVGDKEKRLLPTLLRGELENKLVVQVAAGSSHTICVTKDGLVYACGSGTLGQLGVNDTEHRLVSTLVTGQLQGKTAVYVAAVNYHSLCIIAEGSLFAWGDNMHGQLGVGDTKKKVVHIPTRVRGLQDKQVAQVAAGEQHTICNTTDGCVLTWGYGDRGRLGLGKDDSDRVMPTLVRGLLQNKAAVQVAAGNFSSACVTTDGSVYTWGDSEEGELGVADVHKIDLPQLVHTLDTNARYL